MIAELLRKVSQVATDPVLRHWLIARAAGHEVRPEPFTPHVPPYLDGLAKRNGAPRPAVPSFAELSDEQPSDAIELPLPGRTVRLAPGEAARLFETRFDDLETTLAAHRFAWLPLLGCDAPPQWVGALWRVWMARHSNPDESWAWHPYTAAERAINLLDFAGRVGLPGPAGQTTALLVAHGEVIANRLEYFGDRYTSNHLSNNGRGLFRIGLALGIEEYADLGERILLAEAARLFGRSGVLREGSTHYHLLITRNYADAWLAARAHGRHEASALAEVTKRASAAASAFVLPGGMPLVGDISPDCPPDFLACLVDKEKFGTGWTEILGDEPRAALTALFEGQDVISPAELAGDGWARVGLGPWMGLWHVAPDGWPPMPGHGHQDLGGFELHFDGEALFVDPGRGAYGDRGEAAAFASAAAHNSLMVDGRDPYPSNRPYYSEAFRRIVGGDPPRINRRADGIEVHHNGYTRLAGVGGACRRWSFHGGEMTLNDSVEGRGRHRITRRLHTPHRVEHSGSDILIDTGHNRFRLAAEGKLSTVPSKCWSAYGVSNPATTIDITTTVTLPFETVMTVEAL